MTKKEIEEEIAKTKKRLEELEKRRSEAHNLSVNEVATKIDRAANKLANELRDAGLSGVSSAFGEVTTNGEFAERSLFLGSVSKLRTWKWAVYEDTVYGQALLMRVDNVTGECID